MTNDLSPEELASLHVRFPKKLRPLLEEDHRYKVAEGGRGTAKSWSFATALLVRGAARPQRFLCAREIQKSIKDSVHQLLRDRIQQLQLDGFYRVTNNGIFGENGTQFGFEGLKHNIMNIKSWEGADVAWAEEAQVISRNSYNILIPTIRKEGSEIWITYNPELEEDETHQRFVINPPPDCWHVHMTYLDNPWFPDVLRKEMEHLKATDYAAYLHVWEGQCRPAVAGAIYAQELQIAQIEGRIGEVPYDASKPVNVYWDIGEANYMSIWFEQKVGLESHMIDFMQDHLKKVPFYLDEMQKKGYRYGNIVLPHDAEQDRANAQFTTKKMVSDAFPNAKVIVNKNFPGAVLVGIEAVRNIFPFLRFDKVKCADGLHSLRRYHWKVHSDTGRAYGKEPDHDFSDAPDALRTMAMAYRRGAPPKDELEELMDRQRKRRSTSGQNGKWWA